MLTLGAIGTMLYASDDGYEDVIHVYDDLLFEEQCAVIALVGTDPDLATLKGDRRERNIMLCGLFEHLKIKRLSLVLLVDRLTEELCETDGGNEKLDKLCATALALLEVIMLVGEAEGDAPPPTGVADLNSPPAETAAEKQEAPLVRPLRLGGPPDSAHPWYWP